MRRELLHRLIDEVLDMRGQCATKIPSDAKTHFRSAHREVLLGLRSVIDHALERAEGEASQTPIGSRRIPLDQ